MNDIYEHKAKKYKYKYLKLKNELEGGGVSFLDFFKNNENIKKKTVEILKKVIENVNNVITPIFNNSQFLGLTYSENGYVDDVSTDMKGRDIKDRGRDIKKIYDYMYTKLSVKKQDKYPKTLFFYFQTMNEANENKKSFNVYNFKSKLDKNYQEKLKDLENLQELFQEKDTIFNYMIEPIVRTLDIYLMIMFIKELFYYSSKFDIKTIKLVKSLENDAYINKILYPSPNPSLQLKQKSEEEEKTFSTEIKILESNIKILESNIDKFQEIFKNDRKKIIPSNPEDVSKNIIKKKELEVSNKNLYIKNKKLEKIINYNENLILTNRIQEIIDSINVSIPTATATTPTKK